MNKAKRLDEALARGRRHYTPLLTQSATIQRFTRSSDGMGGGAESWSNVATSIACQVRATSQDEKDTAGISSDTLVVSIDMPATTTNLLTRDRIVVGSNTYYVIGIVGLSGTRNFLVTAIAGMKQLG